MKAIKPITAWAVVWPDEQELRVSNLHTHEGIREERGPLYGERTRADVIEVLITPVPSLSGKPLRR